MLGGVEKDVAKKLMDCFAVMSGPQALIEWTPHVEHRVAGG